eukprot:scpid45773/ scgid34613/ 
MFSHYVSAATLSTGRMKERSGSFHFIVFVAYEEQAEKAKICSSSLGLTRPRPSLSAGSCARRSAVPRQLSSLQLSSSQEAVSSLQHRRISAAIACADTGTVTVDARVLNTQRACVCMYGCSIGFTT